MTRVAVTTGTRQLKARKRPLEGRKKTEKLLSRRPYLLRYRTFLAPCQQPLSLLYAQHRRSSPSLVALTTGNSPADQPAPNKQCPPAWLMGIAEAAQQVCGLIPGQQPGDRPQYTPFPENARSYPWGQHPGAPHDGRASHRFWQRLARIHYGQGTPTSGHHAHR